MKTTRRRAWIGVIALLGGAVMIGAHRWWPVHQERTLLVGGLSPQPDLGAFPSALRDRLTAVEQRVRNGPDARVALGELARLYHANSFVAEANRAYQALTRAEPQNPRWPHLQASMLASYGRLDEALPLLRRVVSLAPDYRIAQLRLGDVLMKRNAPAEAAELYAAVLAREPANVYARDRVNGVSSAEDAREPPDPWVDELVNDCYDPYRITVLAAATRKAGDVRSARAMLERALTIAPDFALAHQQLGLLLTDANEMATARFHLERAVALAPDQPDNWAYLVRLFLQIEDPAAADRTLAEGIAHCPQAPGLHNRRADRLARTGHFEEAIAEYRETIRLRPNQANPYLELAYLYFQLNRPAEGEEIARAALAVEPDHPYGLLLLAQQAIKSGREAEALDWFRLMKRQPRLLPEDIDPLRQHFEQVFGRKPED